MTLLQAAWKMRASRSVHFVFPGVAGCECLQEHMAKKKAPITRPVATAVAVSKGGMSDEML